MQILVQIFGGFPLLPQMCTNINLGSGQYFLYNFVGFLFLPQLCANLNVCFDLDFMNNFANQLSRCRLFGQIQDEILSVVTSMDIVNIM